MSKINTSAGGGLSKVDKVKLVPENIREGVTLFEGSNQEMVGAYKGKAVPALKRVLVAQVDGTLGNYQAYDKVVSAAHIDGYQNLDVNNFVLIPITGAAYGRTYTQYYWNTGLRFPFVSAYDRETGDITITNSGAGYWGSQADCYGSVIWKYYVYALVLA